MNDGLRAIVRRSIWRAIRIVAFTAALGACASTTASPAPASAPPASTSASTGGAASMSASAPSSSPASVDPQPPGRIAFDRYDGAFGAEAPYLGTFIVDPNGGAERRVTVPIDTIMLEPVWSRDATRLLLATWSPPAGPGRPAVVNADGTLFRRFGLPDVDGDVACSGWAPEDLLLACAVVGYAPELDGIYTLLPDGTGLTRVTTSPFHFTEGSAGQCGGGDGRPVFSPDGTRIAFIRQRCGSGANPSADESAALVVVGRDGTGVREIVAQGGVKSHPGSRLSWSPDGVWIAFGSQTGELFVVRPDGTDLRLVPIPGEVGRHHANGPAFSPDGSRIAFSMFVDTESSTDLYSIAPDGSALLRLTASDGAEQFATWAQPPAR